MNSLFENDIHCPYCGELISVLVDCSVEKQEYIEDCQVCCRSITFKVESTVDELVTLPIELTVKKVPATTVVSMNNTIIIAIA